MRTRAVFVSLLSVAFGLPSCGSDQPPVQTGGAGGGSDAPITVKCKGQPSIGNPAPDISIKSLNDQGAASIQPGKVTIVDFWATWCEPCKKSFPKYQDLYVKYKASGLEIVAISVDDDTKGIPEFAKSFGAKFPVGWDKGHGAADCFKVENMPSAYVIDKKGVVKFVHKGYHPGEEDELDKEIKGLL